ncbi:hypothetical protein C8F01DRAFT_1165518 [Mycena amicta]|nr:hypothetical protein C8F01DRAFT_1165518 [Mycena amicta]
MSDGESYGDALHWSFNREHVLFAFLRLDSFGGFLGGALVTVGICVCERLLGYAFDRRWAPERVRRSRRTHALWRAGIYWVLVLLRLAYMLIAMTMHFGLILIAATTLAAGQFFIELRAPPPERDYAPLGREAAPLYPRQSVDPQYRHSHSHSKSQPDGIYPTQVGLGLGRTQPESANVWETGTGPEVARTLLGNGRAKHSTPTPFQIRASGDASSEED